MADKIWPIDKLGNPIKEGELIHLKLEESAALFYVMKVEGASVLNGGSEGNFPVNGSITLVLKFNVPFAPDHNQMFKAMVVKQPKSEENIGIQ
jgi:hypothetical protein